MAATTADRVVTELVADTSGHDPKIRTSAQVVEQAASQIQRSATAAETSANRAFASIAAGAKGSGEAVARSAGSYRAGMQQLGFQINDVATQLASGTRASVVFAQQSSQFVQAIQLMSGGTSRFAAFMGGPWGIALTAGTAVLAPLIARLFDTRTELQKAGDELVENARKAELARRAQEIYGQTLPGVVAHIREQTQALIEQNRTLSENQRIAVQAANTDAQNARRHLDGVRDELASARSDLARAQAERQGAPPGADIQYLRELDARIEGLRQNIVRMTNDERLATEAALRAARGTAEAIIPVARETAERAVDPIRRVTAAYEDMARAAELAATAALLAGNPAPMQNLSRRLTDIRARQRVAEEAAQRAEEERRRREREANRDYSQVPFSEVKSRIIANEGTVRAGGYNAIVYNTPGGGNQYGIPQTNLTGMTIGDVLNYQLNVIRPRTRGHPSANDPRGIGSTGVGAYQFESRTLASQARAAFGPDFRNTLFSGPNQDIIAETLYNAVRGNPAMLRNTWAAFQKGRTGSGGDAAAQIAREEAQRLERERNEAAFQAELGRQNEALLQARQRNVASAEEEARLEIEQVDQARQRQNAGYDAQVTQGRLTQAQADQLKELNDQVAIEEVRTIKIREQQRLDEQRLEIAQRDLNNQESILQARAQLARTAVERRDIELRLLELQHQEELNAIERQREQARQQGTLNAAMNASFDRDRAASNQRYTLGQQSTLRSTAGPMEAFFDAIPKGANELNEALERVAVDGLQQLNDGLAQTAVRLLHIGGVAGQVLNQILSDLIRIGLQQAELALFGGGGKGGGLGGLGGFFARIFGGSGGGGKQDYFGGALSSLGNILGPMKGYASGYIGSIGGLGGADRNVLSINGVDRARVSGSETLAIIPQGKMLGFSGGRATGGGTSGPPIFNINVDARDAVLASTVRGWVREGVEEATARGSLGGVAITANQSARKQRQTL